MPFKTVTIMMVKDNYIHLQPYMEQTDFDSTQETQGEKGDLAKTFVVVEFGKSMGMRRLSIRIWSVWAVESR